jgi:hypothetical protein
MEDVGRLKAPGSPVLHQRDDVLGIFSLRGAYNCMNTRTTSCDPPTRLQYWKIFVPEKYYDYPPSIVNLKIVVYNMLRIFPVTLLLPVYKQPPDTRKGECRNETLQCITMNE